MSVLLNTLRAEFDKLYSDASPAREPIIKKCHDETSSFKTHLKKLKAHLSKQIQEQERLSDSNSEEEMTRIKKKRELVLEKLNKSHRHWDHSVKKQVKHASQQHVKFSKAALAKLYEFDLDKVYIDKLPPNSKKLVDDAISFHISRYNMGNLLMTSEKDMVRYLEDVYGISPATSTNFVRMGQIVQDIKRGDLTSCQKWTSSDSPLNFELYVLRALQLSKTGDTLKTYHHLTKEVPVSSFKQIATRVSPILTQLVLGETVQDIDSQIQIQLEKCISLFTREYCLKRNLPFESPLFLIVLSGIISFQFYVKYTTIRAASHVDWTTKDELPFDVQLPDFLCHFHPIFICPVLKEETTEENPPYSLPCHHILSKRSLDRLSKNGTTTFKCPYCPVCASKSKTSKVKFVML